MQPLEAGYYCLLHPHLPQLPRCRPCRRPWQRAQRPPMTHYHAASVAMAGQQTAQQERLATSQQRRVRTPQRRYTLNCYWPRRVYQTHRRQLAAAAAAAVTSSCSRSAQHAAPWQRMTVMRQQPARSRHQAARRQQPARRQTQDAHSRDARPQAHRCQLMRVLAPSAAPPDRASDCDRRAASPPAAPASVYGGPVSQQTLADSAHARAAGQSACDHACAGS